MKIYILTRLDDDIVYDAFDGKVVRAKNELEARKIANNCVGDEGSIWEDATKVSCEVVKISGPAGEILSSFHAG